ncbi:probable E3 ubiquitin-protein ligase HERC6 isoform X1 [Phycodurus eques]|uniref:probable E3 ubiquitin-protein ligase HERC6 isoform X1 n=1 Tax=Phycodurus eques TaxID=693459 RepID=UPI002ACD5C87|nr:probable E3 ubiquitin-protein ligase HERC6 isoform X1 [Phycodurus eques]
MSRILFWGDSACGHFGPQASSRPVSWSVPGVVSNICCGEQHVLFLLEDGLVSSYGSDSRRQLGRKVFQSEKTPSGRVEGLAEVVSVACGQDHSLALCASGGVYSWGAAEDGQLGLLPNRVYNTQRASPVQIPMPIPVIQVACGNYYSLALTKGGDVFSWGLNSHGQLGLGRQTSLQYTPLQVPALNGIPVSQISAGAAHALFLTLSGLVYCCGANQHGQLGLNRIDDKGRFNICVVPALRRLSVSFITCGEAHSAVLTKEGKVYTFGEGAHGQLGHGSSANQLTPKPVDGMDGVASQVACGRRHTLVLGSSGQIWAFGSGVKGQIGSGKAEGSPAPVLVRLPWSCDSASVVPSDLKIAAGWNTSFAFTSSQSGKQRPITGRLDEKKLLKWLTLKKCNPEAEREILEMFFTSSSLVASFTKSIGLSLNADALNVDLEAASRAFSKMLAVPWIRKKVNLAALMNVLVTFRSSLKSPEIIVILLSCPLLHDVSAVLANVLPLAVVVDVMSERTQATLKGWWSSMPADMLLQHILVFKNALDFVIKNGLLVTHFPGIKATLEVLKLLYKANKRGKSYKVPLSTFYVEDFDNRTLVKDVFLWRQHSTKEDDVNTPPTFCRYPFVLNLFCKVSAFAIFAFITKFDYPGESVSFDVLVRRFQSEAPVFQLSLRPSHLLEDTFRQLNAADHVAFKKELLVQFVDDRKVMNVNRRDLFLHIFDELMAPQSNLFMYNDRKMLAWFPPKPKVAANTYFLFGVLCGLALHNQNMVHLPFPLVLFRKLLGVKPSLDDMKEFEPTVGEGLRCILEDYSDNVLKDMETTFTVSWGGDKVELDPEDSEKLVTGSNKKEFVTAFVNYAFNKSVEGVFEAFKKGFFKVCEPDVVAFFQPDELQAVMVGNENYDWDVFKQNTVYEGEYHAAHPNIVIFWEVFDKLTEEEKKKFLSFLTGCDRVPFAGMASLQMKIAILPASTDLHYPEALTCHYLLLLPIYHRYPIGRQMHNRLLYAINHSRGFTKTFNTEG